jgi:2-polyprenyl-3-methyl-5-hydroxy-6-metoxy-1,4-benzoquinol methylase
MADFINIYQKEPQRISQIDRDIRQYIADHEDGNFAEVLLREQRWQVFLQLSILRTALLAWYEFSPKADILEVAAGFGSLTGVLCQKGGQVTVTERSAFRAETISERYKHMMNLTVYAGDLKDIVFDKKFDYIVLPGILELQGNGKSEQQPYIAYLEQVKSLLKPGGKLLIAVENRYGLKYFCGEAEPYTKEFFAGINKYPVAGRGYCFDRQELIDLLQAAGFPYYKFYYPVPDYKLPQVIYSDQHLPGDEMRERIIPYYNSSSLIASESALYGDIARNGVFGFFANSFFIECGKKDDFCPVDYAAVTVDRGNETSFVTSIYKKEVVKKQALYEEGKVGLRNLQKHMQALAMRKIAVVPTEFKNEAVYMPYIKEPTLANYLRSLQKEDKSQVLAVFDELWECIIKSSEPAAKMDCNLLKLAPQADWGPVLENAYMEMIPMNCFYQNGKMTFFDQEFVKENYPAKYPMFRALAFIYYDLREIVSLTELQKRYGITEEMWSAFWSIEVSFFNGLRNTDAYHQFYARRENPVRIHKNRQIMSLLD